MFYLSTIIFFKMSKLTTPKAKLWDIEKNNFLGKFVFGEQSHYTKKIPFATNNQNMAPYPNKRRCPNARFMDTGRNVAFRSPLPVPESHPDRQTASGSRVALHPAFRHRSPRRNLPPVADFYRSNDFLPVLQVEKTFVLARRGFTRRVLFYIFISW